MRIALTAGFDRAPHAVALAALATRDGHEIAGILIVRPWSRARLREWVRKNGLRATWHAANRLRGGPRRDPRDAAVAALLEREGIAHRSLSGWARRHRVRVVSCSSLNSRRAIAFIAKSAIDGVLYAGGGILSPAFLGAARGRVLNAHAGPLPHVRGMNACEWALLLGLDLAVTIHWIDAGIDTGEVVERIPIAVEPGDTIDRLRGKTTVAGVLGLRGAIARLSDGPTEREPRRAPPARQCFTMAPVLRELLAARLEAPVLRGSGVGTV